MHEHSHTEILLNISIPFPIQIVIFYTTQAITIVAAILIFECVHWARHLYLAIGAASILYRALTLSDASTVSSASTLTDADYLLGDGIFYFVAALILFLPTSNLFFYQNKRPAWK